MRLSLTQAFPMILKTLPLLAVLLAGIAFAEPTAKITGNEPGWVALAEKDFVQVNSADETWTFDDAAQTISCTGQPISVMSTEKAYTNFELVLEWKHVKPAGNSGIFLWTSKRSLDELKAPGLPDEGIEVQILDLGYIKSYEKSSGKPADWFTCHGDVFPGRKSQAHAISSGLSRWCSRFSNR